MLAKLRQLSENLMTKIKQVFVVASALAMAILTNAQTFGQASDTELFTVTAPTVLTVTSPAASVTITHDKTDSDQVFSVQSWTVAQNGAIGASISFATDQAFTNTVTSSFKRDAKLDLALASSDTGSGWALTTSTDTTDYGTADGVATVSAASTAPGDAASNLTVTFITTDFSTMASGDYAMTVTGTITSN